MRMQYLLAIVLVATAVHAKEPKHFQSGKLLKMQSVKCGTDAKKKHCRRDAGHRFFAHENPRIAVSGVCAANRERDLHNPPQRREASGATSDRRGGSVPPREGHLA